MFSDEITQDVLKKIEEIVGLFKESKLAVFCGSGISVKEPSNLPTGKDLVHEIIDTLKGNLQYRET